MATFCSFLHPRAAILAALVAATAASRVATATPLALGELAQKVVLDAKAGGRVDGKAWHSDSMKGKVQLLFYVDPDEKDANESLEKQLKKAALPRDKFGTVAVINMEASWLPNAAIASSLKSKQKEFPDVVYVKDLNKTLVQKWGLKDDAYVSCLFDKQGKLLFMKDGTLAPAEGEKLIELIQEHLDDPRP